MRSGQRADLASGSVRGRARRSGGPGCRLGRGRSRGRAGAFSALSAHPPAQTDLGVALCVRAPRFRALTCVAYRGAGGRALWPCAEAQEGPRNSCFGQLRCTAARQEQAARTAFSRLAGSRRGGARVSEAAGWGKRTAAHLHPRPRALRRARAALHRAGVVPDAPFRWSSCEARSGRHALSGSGGLSRSREFDPDADRTARAAAASHAPLLSICTARSCSRPCGDGCIQRERWQRAQE